MLRSRLLVIPAAVAVAGASVFVSAGAATADVTTNDPTSTWVNTPAQFQPLTGVDTPLDSGWGVSAEGGTDALTFDVNGVSSAQAFATLLHPTAETTLTADDLVDLGATLAAVGTGQVEFLITLTDDGAATTLRTTIPLSAPASATTVPADALWTNGRTTNALDAGQTETLSDFTADLASDDTSITGYGAQLIPTASDAGTHLAAFEAEEATTYFTPTPAGTVTSATPTVTQFTTTGVVLTGSGYTPGETLTFGFGTADGGRELDGVTAIADANGTFSKAIVAPAPVTAGTQYLVFAVGATSGVDIVYGVVPVADPAVPVAPVPTAVRTTATFTG